MNSVIFRCAAGTLLPVMLLLSVVVLLRGHNEPGGGFLGGLLAASGFVLYGLANGSRVAARKMRLSPMRATGLGLLLAALSGAPAMVLGLPYLEGLWMTVELPGFPEPLKVGTPLVFDVGVYLLVVGGATLMVLTLEETYDDHASGD